MQAFWFTRGREGQVSRLAKLSGVVVGGRAKGGTLTSANEVGRIDGFWVACSSLD